MLLVCIDIAKKEDVNLQNKVLSIIVIIIMVVAAVAALQLSPKTPSTDARNIKIGLVAPVSGSSIGQDMSKAAQMAVNEINDAGGIYVSDWNTKVNITLITADTNDDALGNAVTPVTKAVESDQVDLLIGGYGSAGTLANELVAIDDKVPYIITGASNQLVTRRGPQGNYGGLNSTDPQAIADADGMSYIFHYYSIAYYYSKTVDDFLKSQMKPAVALDRNFRLAIIYCNDTFGTGVDQVTKYWIQKERLPIDIVAERAIATTTTSYQTDLTLVAAQYPDAVIVADNPDRTPESIKEGLADVGLKTAYIAIENNQDPTVYSLLGGTGDGQLLESKLDPYTNSSYSPLVQSYVQKFNQTYGVMPGMIGADTYDAFYIVKDAIERAGTVDKALVRQAIEDTNLNQMTILTTTGKIKFSTGTNYHEIDQSLWGL